MAATIADNIPPVISSVQASIVTAATAVILWSTDEPGDSQIEYGTTTAYGSATLLNAAMATAHSQSLSGLASGTLYHYRVKSRDAAGNLAMSGDFTFSTLTPPDTTPPAITGVLVASLAGSSATIMWATDEPSDSQVEYGPSLAYGSTTPLNAALVTAHSQSLSGLTSGILYHYRVKSRDSAGNLAVSADYTFSTLTPAAAPLPDITEVKMAGPQRR